jgi:hypothetical protein
MDHHIFMEQAVHVDVLEGHFALHHFQVFSKISPQHLTHTPAANTNTPIRGVHLTALVENR